MPELFGIKNKKEIIPIFKLIKFLEIITLIYSNQNILVFNSQHYRYGHSAISSKGDLVIEYSYNNYRLFYGIKKNGKNYFNDNGNQSSTKEITIDTTNYYRYESRNIFIFLNNTYENTKEYLYSCGAYYGTVKSTGELHDFENNEIVKKDNIDILGTKLYSHSFSLFSINNTNNYVIAFTTGNNTNPTFLKMISFSNFNFDNIIINSAVQKRSSSLSRVVNSFQMNENIILIYLEGNHLYYNIYDLELKEISTYKQIDKSGVLEANGVFFKGVHIKNNIIGLMLFNETNGASLKIKIGSISGDGFLESFDYKFSNYQFSYDDRINDFIKLNEERLIYVGKNKADNSEFIIFLFDL